MVLPQWLREQDLFSDSVSPIMEISPIISVKFFTPLALQESLQSFAVWNGRLICLVLILPSPHIYFVARQILWYSAMSFWPQASGVWMQSNTRGNSAIHINDCVFQICTEEGFFTLCGMNASIKGKEFICWASLPSPSQKEKSKAVGYKWGDISKFTKSLEAFQKSPREQNEHILIKILLGAYLHLQMFKWPI